MSNEAAALFLAGRILFAITFAADAGVGHLRQAKMMTGYAKQAGFPFPFLAGAPAGLWLIAGGLSVALGVWGEVGALMTGLFVIPAALWFHRFWTLEDAMQRQMQRLLFFRNVSFLGASLVLFAIFASAEDSLRFVITGPLLEL